MPKVAAVEETAMGRSGRTTPSRATSRMTDTGRRGWEA